MLSALMDLFLLLAFISQCFASLHDSSYLNSTLAHPSKYPDGPIVVTHTKTLYTTICPSDTATSYENNAYATDTEITTTYTVTHPTSHVYYSNGQDHTRYTSYVSTITTTSPTTTVITVPLQDKPAPETQFSEVTQVYVTTYPTSSICSSGNEPTTSHFTATATITTTYTWTVPYTTTVSPSASVPPIGGYDPSSSSPGHPSQAPTYPSHSQYLNSSVPSQSSQIGSSSLSGSSVSQGLPSSSKVSSSTFAPSQSSSMGPAPSSSAITKCPAIWQTIVAEMKQVFAGCTEPARSSIRFAFHDAAGYSSTTTPYSPASGGADGSLLLNDDEIARSANAPMPFARTQLKAQWENYKDQNVSAADFVQMSGLIAVRSCGGPVYTMLVGREDDPNACPDGTLPAAFGPNSAYDILVQLWADKGIDERELAALIGAHTVSRAFAQQSNGIPPAGPQDSTFSTWDTNYFKRTQAQTAPAGVYRFQSDINLGMANTTVGQAFSEFGESFDAWNTAYSAAGYKLSLLGVPQAKIETMADCTGLAQ